MIDPPPSHTAPASSTRQRRRWWRWWLTVRGLMVLILVVGGVVGWYVRQIGGRREALATVAAAGGNVTYVDQRANSRGWWARLYRATGHEFCREVDQVVIGPLLTPPPQIAANGQIIPPTPTAPPDVLAAEACAAIARLGRVKWVNFSGDRVTAPALANLASASVHELSLLNLAKTDDATLAQIRQFRHLKVLTISGAENTKLPRATLAAVGDLTQLEELNLHGISDLQVADLAPLHALHRLKSITIYDAPEDERCLDHLGSLEQLTTLGLGKTRLTDAGLRRLVARAPRLRSLSAEGSLLTDGGVAALASLPDLKILTLSCMPGRTGRFTDASLQTLGRLRSLEYIFLGGGRFTDAGLDALQGLPLARLDLDSIEASEAAIARLLAGRTFFWLGLHGPGVTDAVVPLLTGHLTRRSGLDLSRSRITDAGMSPLATLPVRVLQLNNTEVTDLGLATLSTRVTYRLLMMYDTPVTTTGAATFRAAHPGISFVFGPTPPSP